MATFSDLDKAHKVRLRLIQAGVPAEVKDESKWQRFWFLSRPLAADKVVVPSHDYDRAMAVLKEADERDHLLQGELRCPQCGSAAIQFPQFTRKFVTTTIVEILCLLHILDRQFYCEGCHFTWPVSHGLRPREDVLNWPAKKRGLVRQERV